MRFAPHKRTGITGGSSKHTTSTPPAPKVTGIKTAKAMHKPFILLLGAHPAAQGMSGISASSVREWHALPLIPVIAATAATASSMGRG